MPGGKVGRWETSGSAGREVEGRREVGRGERESVRPGGAVEGGRQVNGTERESMGTGGEVEGERWRRESREVE